MRAEPPGTYRNAQAIKLGYYASVLLVLLQAGLALLMLLISLLAFLGS